MKHSYIWITFDFEGFHYWPDAPDDVAFLRHEHRHLFCVKIYISVDSNDREIEFFQFQRFCKGLVKENKLNYKSCEMIAEFFYEEISKSYPNRVCIIEVSEDNENGAHIEFTNEK